MKIDFAERRSFVLQGVKVVIEPELCSGNYTMEHGQHLDSSSPGGGRGRGERIYARRTSTPGPNCGDVFTAETAEDAEMNGVNELTNEIIGAAIEVHRP
jgi:hypothetical protein